MDRKTVLAFGIALLLATEVQVSTGWSPVQSQRNAGSPSVVAPSIPTKFQISFATNSSITLLWQPPLSNGGSQITNYTVYRGTSLGTESLFKVLGNTNSYLDAALRGGTSYFYQVTASNAAGEGRRSYEVGARVGATFALTVGATYLDTGPLLSSYPSQSSRSSLSSVGVNVWTNYVYSSTTLNLSGLPSGTYLYPFTLPVTKQGSFSFNLALVTDGSSTSVGSFPLTLSAQGPLGDAESIPLTLNVRNFGASPSPSSLYLGQNETMLGTICPTPASSTWANITVSVVYQKPDNAQVAHLSLVSVSKADICAGSQLLDSFVPDETGTWYAHATVTLETWDGSSETIATPSSTLASVPPSFSVSFTVSVVPPKSLSVSLGANPTSVASGGSSVLTASVTASDHTNPAVTYRWTASGGTLNSTTGNPVAWTAPVVQSSTSFSVSATVSATGYVDGSNSISVLVMSPQPLTATIAENSSSGFAPLTVQFGGAAAGGYPPYSFKWNFGDGGASSLQNPTHVFSTPGNYTTTLYVTDSRSSNASKNVLIMVAPRPALALSVSAVPTNGTTPLAVQFSSVVSGGTSPYSYAWTFGDGGSSSAALPLHTYSLAGTYTATLSVTDSTGTTVKAAVQIIAAVPSYTAAFFESGLPNGTSWTITFNGQSYSSMTNSVKINAVPSGAYQWSVQEVDTCQGCRYTALQPSGMISIPGALSQLVSFQAEYLVSLVASPAGGGMIAPAGNDWYPAGKVIALSARPNGTFVLDGWVASQTITLGGTSVIGGAAQTTATVNGPGTITARFADAWKGSYIRVYYGEQTWHPKIVEVHIAAIDATGKWAGSAVTAVGILRLGEPQMVGSVGAAGVVFSFITEAGAIEGLPNTDGSHDFTVIQIAGNAAYLYAGLQSANMMAPTPLEEAPIWVGLLPLPAPSNDRLVFGDSIIPYSTVAALGATSSAGGAQTIVSLIDFQGRLYLTVQDAQGRTTGVDARSNATIAKIPGSYYLQIGRAMAVVLPANLTSFSYSIDASRASQPRENFTVSLDVLGNSGFALQKEFAASINKGSTMTFGAGLSPGGITNVELYAVSLDAVDSLGLPATDATATLTSAGGVSVTISPGTTRMLSGGAYLLTMSYRGQDIHESVNIVQNGVVSVRVSLSTYGVLLIAGILAAFAAGSFVMWKRLGKGRTRPKVSEWLR